MTTAFQHGGAEPWSILTPNCNVICT